MPILVKDFTWMQTDKTINIKVPLKPVYRENVDIFTTDSYIKVNFSPFLLELFLLHDVDNDSSKCIVNDDVIILDLFKKEEQEWDQLEKILTKPEKMKIKQQILEKCAEAAKQKCEDKLIKKTQLDRFAVQRAMDIDNIQHNLMDSRRNAEKDKAMNELENWRQQNCDDKFSEMAIWKGNNVKSSVEITELKSDDDEEKEVKECKEIKDVKNRIKTKQERTSIKTPVKSEYVNKKREELKKRVLPKPRQAGVVEIRHTARLFPTPCRESTANEEETWLKNITLARRATGFVSEDLRPEEQDPQWCKEKGDEFFRSGNFLGAVSAYTHGITLSDKLPSLFSNRAATHFALGNFNKCVNDCSTALDLMKPPCEGNRRSRAKCIARRAAALARLGYLNKAIDEMKAAAKLLPDDENIKKDVYDMERAWEQNPDSD